MKVNPLAVRTTIPQRSLEDFMARHGLDSLIVIGTRAEREVVLCATVEGTHSFAVAFHQKVETPLRALLNDVLRSMGRAPIANENRRDVIEPGKIERRIPLVPAGDDGLLKVPEGLQR